jgi:hypothetical protein
MTIAPSETYEHGYVHRGRENGHVRSGSTAAETNCDESPAVESGQFRRQQVLCEDHRIIGDGQVHRPCFTHERQQDVRFDIQEIVGTFAQPGVAQGFERLHLAAGGSAPCVPGTFPRGNEFLCGLVHDRIVEKLDVGGRDFATRHAARCADPRQACANIGTRLLELGAFVRQAGALLLDDDLATLDARSPPDGETGNRRGTRQTAIDSAAGALAGLCCRRRQ